MIIDAAAYEAMIVHMQQARPQEGVGLLAGSLNRPSCPRDTDGDGDCGQPMCPECGAGGGRVDRWVPLPNVAEFPRARYQVDDDTLIDAWNTLHDHGRRPWIMVHSHTRTSAAPSELDVQYAADPTLLHMIVSLAGTVPHAALWRLTPGAAAPDQVRKIRYQVVDLGFQPKTSTDLTHGVTAA